MPYPLSDNIVCQFLTLPEFEQLPSHDAVGQSIQNVTDLFSFDYAKLKLFSQNKNIDFKKLVELRNYYKNILLSNSYTLDVGLKCKLQKHIKLKCGSEALNIVLAEIPSECVVEVLAPSSSGKSQFLFSLALESAINGKRVIFIDTNLSFSKRRLIQILRNKYKEYSEKEIDDIFEKINIYRLFTIEQVIDLLEALPHASELDNSLLIIDSITSLLFTDNFESDNKKEIFKRRLSILIQLNEAIKYVTNCAKLITFFTRLFPCEINLEWNSLADFTITFHKQISTENIIVNCTNKTLNTHLNQCGEITFEINDYGIV